MKLKHYTTFLLLLLFIFTYEVNLLADEDKNEKIMYQIIDRARLAGKIINYGEPSEFSKLFNSNKENYHEISVTMADWNGWLTDPKKKQIDNKTQQNVSIYKEDYVFYIYNGEINSFMPTDSIIVSLFKSEDKSDTPVVYGYTEFGLTLKTWGTYIQFYRNGKPQLCEVRFDLKGEKKALIEWNEKGEITTKKDLHYLSENKIVVPIMSQGGEKIIDKENKVFIKIQQPKFPQTNDKEVNAIFARIKSLAELKRPVDILQLYKWKRNNDNNSLSGTIYCVDGNIRDFHFSAGYSLSLDDKGRIDVYAEGKMSGSKKSLRSVKSRDKKDGKKRLFIGNSNDLIYVYKGIEVEFHISGYPASYRSIVGDRLYGRQIEWNDKGEVISDIDLDIPKEWKNTPKKTDDNPTKVNF
ncbi:MAG: hypothetical protein LBE18_09990 [Planctomycetaceae bacterium]|jgi:hypothetical protein|nr:hypothetical protein [Planctomycetaceae bacterium]